MIKSGSVVTLAYQLRDQEGEILDEADAKDPFSYLHGADQIVPGLQNALNGLSVGDRKQVVVTPDQGYGERNESLVLSLSKADFPTEADLEEGMQFMGDLGEGESAVFTVQEVSGDVVTVDGNHPLAGETLHFEIEVLEVRDATAEEKAHGHAHGPNGHHH